MGATPAYGVTYDGDLFRNSVQTEIEALDNEGLVSWRPAVHGSRLSSQFRRSIKGRMVFYRLSIDLADSELARPFATEFN